MSRRVFRREFLQQSAAALTIAAPFGFGARAAFAADESTGEHRGTIYKSVKFGMFGEKISIKEKFQILKDLGYDGVEMNSPGGADKKKARAASTEVGLPIHGVVDSIHWGTRLSDPSEEVRAKGLAGLKTAIEETSFLGGSAVLLVPGAVRNPERENHQHVWDRSIVEIRKALPLASRLGIHILIENVWNGFCYDPNGPDNQTAKQLARYIDEIDSPWVGVYFDIGNHQRFGKPAEWIRTLGRRIVKLDVKDWKKSDRPSGSWTKIGDGDVDWADVRRALKDIRFSGWSTAEVGGGDRNRMKEIAGRMDRALGL